MDQPGVVKTARSLSHFGEHSLGWLGLAALGAGLDRPRRRQWVALGVSAFSAHAASVVIKRVIRRARPHDPRIRIGVDTPSKLSFPSSHATSTSAALASLARLSGSALPLAGIPVMMGSRMVLGVHYPSDTLAGALLGVTTSRVITTIERKLA
ncbi:phosphatase PAP2 family protein [Corynebacterium alimapuense]|uniref:Phosphatase PAP2 family protein n=2 Tax=Corynebacterium alimapuense TaxID=1576874 RepID=A0A3M8KA25_9CORY|nr:phosphatase PAP2 family protein [Corynebacterium alimapuense]